MFPDTAISGEDPQVVSLFVGVCLYGSFARGDLHEFICHIIRSVFTGVFDCAEKECVALSYANYHIDHTPASTAALFRSPFRNDISGRIHIIRD
jgi:hypothetical protein